MIHFNQNRLNLFIYFQVIPSPAARSMKLQWDHMYLLQCGLLCVGSTLELRFQGRLPMYRHCCSIFKWRTNEYSNARLCKYTTSNFLVNFSGYYALKLKKLSGLLNYLSCQDHQKQLTSNQLLYCSNKTCLGHAINELKRPACLIYQAVEQSLHETAINIFLLLSYSIFLEVPLIKYYFSNDSG